MLNMSEISFNASIGSGFHVMALTGKQLILTQSLQLQPLDTLGLLQVLYTQVLTSVWKVDRTQTWHYLLFLIAYWKSKNQIRARGRRQQQMSVSLSMHILEKVILNIVVVSLKLCSMVQSSTWLIVISLSFSVLCFFLDIVSTLFHFCWYWLDLVADTLNLYCQLLILTCK